MNKEPDSLKNINLYRWDEGCATLIKTVQQNTLQQIWEPAYGKYAYRYKEKNGKIGKPINKLSKLCKSNVIFSNTPGLCEFHKSKPLGESYTYSNYIDDMLHRDDSLQQRTADTNLNLSPCVASKIQKI